MTAVALAQYADLCSFLITAHLLGIGGEANPLMRTLYDVSPLTVVGAKLLVVGLVGAYHGMGRNSLHAVAITAGVIGSAVNTASALLSIPTGP